MILSYVRIFRAQHTYVFSLLFKMNNQDVLVMAVALVSGEIKLDFGSPYAMREAVEFLYLGQVRVTYERVRELLEVAEYLQITDMKKCCSDFLFTQDLTKENCIQVGQSINHLRGGMIIIPQLLSW